MRKAIGCTETAPLDLEAYYDYDSASHDYTMPKNGGGNSSFIVSGTTYNLSAPLLDILYLSSWLVCYQEHAFTLPAIVDATICQPENYYQWGFAFGLTFFFLLATLWLAIALYIVRLCTFRGGDLADSVFGGLKTAVQVSAALDRAVGGKSAEINNVALEKERKAQGIAVPLSKVQNLKSDDSTEDSKRPLMATRSEETTDGSAQEDRSRRGRRHRF